jgi:hypothetical protein
MPQTGFTPIQIYSSSTTTNTPAAGDLTNNTLGSELAINIADGKLFYKDNANNVQVVATKDSAAGNFTTVDTTNLEVTNIKAKDGTSALSIADSTGIVTGTTPQIISVTDNTNAALRITQLGTGNALLVEDSASPDATPFVIDANGRVINGYTASLSIGIGGNLGTQLTGSAGASGQTLARFDNGSVGARFQFYKSRNANPGSSTILQNGDSLGTIAWYGDDGAADYASNAGVLAALIGANVDGTPGTNDMPGRLIFSTTADGASSPTERMRIDSTGLTSLQNNAGLQIARTAVTAPAATDGNVFSGTYTPTLTNTTNITSSTAFSFSYMRVGNVVTVQGRVTIVPASAAACQLDIALPIASNLALENLSGCAGPTSVATVGMLDGNATLDTARILFTAPATTSRQWPVSFTYRVI